ncbi:lysoplasmalogenase family protein [Corynebacterium kalidii]|uniref:Lysoplasmalogenase n=1 Tax=Corynebacterium kalidii TaxID=2931982 RepID=A0A9X1WE07_9CORY|nr:lysoplasmalogenase family protein [Corynebacterium kalidii]MCJ7857259.1 lysoplasmalogenase [Corynebacterium kalidii]
MRLWRAAYLAAGAASVAAAAAGRRGDRMTRVVKPTLMPLLGAHACTRAACASRATQGNRLPVVLAGLAGGLLGDVILMGDDGRSDDPAVRARNLNRGSAAFSVNQVAYIGELWRRGHRPRRSTVVLRVPVLVSGMVTAATGAPAALPAAAGYGTALAATSVLAADPQARTDGSSADLSGLGLGGNLFVLSDGLILARLAFLRGGFPAVQRLDGLVDGLVMATYVAAQLLIVEGLTGQKK